MLWLGLAILLEASEDFLLDTLCQSSGVHVSRNVSGLSRPLVRLSDHVLEEPQQIRIAHLLNV